MCGVRGGRTMATTAMPQPQENSVPLIEVKVIEDVTVLARVDDRA
jgi:hypothetical protein